MSKYLYLFDGKGHCTSRTEMEGVHSLEALVRLSDSYDFTLSDEDFDLQEATLSEGRLVKGPKRLLPGAEEALRLAEKKSERARGFESGFFWGGVEFKARPSDLGLVTSRVVAAFTTSGTPSPIRWRTKRGDRYEFTPIEFARFHKAMDRYVEEQYEKSWK